MPVVGFSPSHWRHGDSEHSLIRAKGERFQDVQLPGEKRRARRCRHGHSGSCLYAGRWRCHSLALSQREHGPLFRAARSTHHRHNAKRRQPDDRPIIAPMGTDILVDLKNWLKQLTRDPWHQERMDEQIDLVNRAIAEIERLRAAEKLDQAIAEIERLRDAEKSKRS